MNRSITATKNLSHQRILLTGGTGFIGRALVAHLLDAACQVTVYTRNAAHARAAQPGAVVWVEDWSQLPATTEFDVLINLAGESLADGRWTNRKKKRLFASRLDTTLGLLKWVRRARIKPRYLLSASAVGAYGPRDARPLDEASDGVPSFGQQLCQEWEQAADEFAAEGMAVCKLRFGVVFARDGGAFTPLRRPFDFGVAVRMGDGIPYCSWIHRDDLIRAVEFLLLHQRPVIGVVNLTAPEPLTYAELARQLGTARRAWVRLSLPAPLLRLLLGEMAQELLLSGQNVRPARLQAMGFEFLYPNFTSALPDLLA
jgi:uncharacterized protein (TIGR01777 family)